jgi:hypothetical protein
MYKFNELGIKPAQKTFEGPKVAVYSIFNKLIVVEDYKIEASKFKEKGNGKRLVLQVIVDNSKRIVFSGSANLMDMIERVPKDRFPFQTTIINENDRFQFT